TSMRMRTAPSLVHAPRSASANRRFCHGRARPRRATRRLVRAIARASQLAPILKGNTRHERRHLMGTMKWQPAWWNDGHASAWERVKEAMRRDWEQTKHDLHLKGGHELNQGVKDTVKQA